QDPYAPIARSAPESAAELALSPIALHAPAPAELDPAPNHSHSFRPPLPHLMKCLPRRRRHVPNLRPSRRDLRQILNPSRLLRPSSQIPFLKLPNHVVK